MVRVKICGITSAQDVATCVRSGADALGFIFAPGPRRIHLELAAWLTKLVPPFVTTVGVFAGDDAAFVREALEQCRLDVLQFSGGETPVFAGSFGRPTIVVVHASPHPEEPSGDSARDLPFDRDALARARAVAVMVDARSATAHGGTGQRVDERLARRMCGRSALPFILAGGLTPDNVAGAIAAVRPWAVDVRSGVERADVKDRGLVERFVRAAHAASDQEPLETSAFAQTAQPLGGMT